MACPSLRSRSTTRARAPRRRPWAHGRAPAGHTAGAGRRVRRGRGQRPEACALLALLHAEDEDD
eukprot:9740574-Alexandrium_andersonii.AAC.1